MICAILLKKGPYFPFKIIGDRKITKQADEYDEDYNKKMTQNYQAMNILCCALYATKYNRVSGCETANAIWKLLKVTHEGNNQVKESQMGMLVRDYNSFL